MREERSDAVMFGRESPVWAYWLGRCVGFDVVSRRGDILGTVRSIDGSDAGAVLICRFRGRELRLLADAIDAVAPQERRLYAARGAIAAARPTSEVAFQEKARRSLRSLTGEAARAVLATRRRTAIALARIAEAVAPDESLTRETAREDQAPVSRERAEDETPVLPEPGTAGLTEETLVLHERQQDGDSSSTGGATTDHSS